jgi:type II secretory pathway pseudopilin PulG
MISLRTSLKSARAGFTVIEILLVIGIGAITLSTLAPLAGKYSERQRVETEVQGLLSNGFRYAQARALKYENDSSWGVYLNQDAANPYYVVFATTDGTYAGRNVALDRKTMLPVGMLPSGTSTVLFHKGDGTTAGGTVTLTYFGITRTITIGALGVSEVPSASVSSGASSSTADLSLFLE